MASESSRRPDPRTYDVFLNFRGEDSCATFISNLYQSFADAGIHVYRDDVELRKGDEVSESISKAIEGTKISLLVFSKNYASSRWCLEELVHIMECRRTMGQVVVPLFYDVDPSEVRYQTGVFGRAFEDHIERFSEDRVNVWRAALKDAANIMGFELSNSRNLSEANDNILHCVSGLLYKARFSPEDQYQPETYDVFLSFRGPDTRGTFISDLYKQLTKAGVHVYLDEVELQKGEDISTYLNQAIQASRIAIIVFSENYAGSSMCLRHTEKIMECYRTKGQVVVPVFYCIEPSDVRKQTGPFREALYKWCRKYSENEVNVWREALTDSANLSGIHVSNSRNGSEAIDDIVERITSLLHSKDLIDPEAGGILGFVVKDYSRNRGEDIKKVAECVTRWVNRTNLFVAIHPVGVQDGVQFLVKQLNKQKSDDVLLLGIWGMGGIGKTTFAKALYNQIGCEFEGSSFLLDIRNAWQRERHASLQERILSDIFLTRQRTIPDNESGKRRLEQGLRDKKVLLLLDGVNKMEQLDALCGSRKWFGPGSIIIITTRDKRLLIDRRVDLVHTMKEMDERESIELFSWHAFRQASPRQDFAELCGNIVSYCGGLPLALFVLGSELFGKEMTEWKNVLDGLREAPHPVVQDLLRISFDDLNDDKERDLFLDISFFFIGINKEDVIHALKGYGGLVESGITALEDRSLVKVDENGKFGMHILLREMGREILHELFRKEPGPMIYDVFLSFRADTRASFTSHLYTYLQNAGCHVFKDDESLQRGDQISMSMMQAIGRSRISVVVLSEKYPNSRWCMTELEKILECRRTTKQQVLPVFYGVKPSEVLNSGVPSEERSMFREAFEELLENISVDKDRELDWKRALADISAVQGHVIANSGNQSEDIKKIVADVTKMLNKKYLFVAKHPVGVESRVTNTSAENSERRRE